MTTTEEKLPARIPEYFGNNQPTEEEILICEKVLKYVAQCQYITFSEADALKIIRESTNILRWNFGYNY